jgi:hypothetical protein
LYRLTDFLFYKVNPQLNNRKLQASDRDYILEWQRLRAAIDPRVKPAQEVCNSPGPADIGWEFTVINGETYEQTYDKARSNQWLAIRREIYISTCGI